MTKNNRHNLKLYSDEDLINLCKQYQHSKDIPRWLYHAIRHRNIQDFAISHITSLNPQRSFDEIKKTKLTNMNAGLIFKRNRIGLTSGRVNTESLTKFVKT